MFYKKIIIPIVITDFKLHLKIENIQDIPCMKKEVTYQVTETHQKVCW